MSFVFPTNASQVQAFAGALYGVQVGSATMAQVNADILANGGLNATLNGYYSATFGSNTAAAAAAVAKNFGLTGAVLTEGTAYVTSQLNAVALSARGAVISNIVNMFGTYSADLVFGGAATAWNTKLATAVAYTGATNVAVGTANAPVVVNPGIFTLTTNADLLSPSTTVAQNKTGAGNDTIYAVDNGSLTSADIIDGGDGTDVIIASATANSQTLAPILTSIDTVTITHTATDTKTFKFDAANATGLTLVNIKAGGAVSDNAGDETITVSGLAKTASLGIIGGTASTGATGAVLSATFTGAAAADTQTVEISAGGKATSLTLATATTVQITATGNGTTSGNALGTLAATAVTKLNILGTGDLAIAASDLAAAPTIDASTTTGVIAFTGETAATTTTFTGGSGNTTVATASTGIVKVTTGAGADVVDFLTAANTATVSTGGGNDEVRVGAQAQVTSQDSIDGGDGTDTITVSDGTINATTRTTLATGIKNFEVVQTTSTTGVIVDFNALSTYKTVSANGADTGVAAAAAAAAAAQGTAGAASVALTTINDSIFNVSASRVGQAGQAAIANAAATAGGAGGAGISIVPNLDNGSNAATLKIIGGLTFTGGAGGAADGEAQDVTGAGGSAISASTIEVLNLDISGTNTAAVGAATVTLTAGAAGGAANGATAGAAGSGLVVGTNATVNITSSLTGATAAANNNLTLGTVVGTNVTINASTFAGKLSLTAASGNVTINGGSGADSLTAGAGNDTISGGAGADVITGGAAGDVLSGGAGRDSFNIGTAGHSAKTTTTGNVTFDKISDFGKVTISATAAQVTGMNNVAAFQATATAQGGAEADMLDLAATATLAAAATGTDVSAAVTTNPAVTGTISAKGIVTVAGAGASLVDTLAEWIAVAKIMTANTNVAAFEFGGNTYVYQEEAADDVVELTGVTGVTGIVLVGSAVAAAVGDIFVI